MRRLVEPELLDSLAPDDPSAVWSRRDLRRINWWMRNEGHLANATGTLERQPATILELGAGDGNSMLRVAQRWGPAPKNGQIYLLDREPVIARETIDRLSELGWNATMIKADVHEWLRNPEIASVDLITANLFLHHFQEAQLKNIFDRCGEMTRDFVSCEPRRWKPAAIATKLLWLIGCNHVTRHDAIVSVRAGFADRELSELWQDAAAFKLTERSAGLASHLFIAQKRIE